MPLHATPVRVTTPATCANLGPGFDSLGLAVTLYDDLVAEVTPAGVEVCVHGHGADVLPTDERHLIVATMFAVFDQLGERPSGLRLVCHNRIPHARGLGSSSAAIVSAILAARALVADGPTRLPDHAVLQLAARLEGHPDNVAPCLLGGVTVAWTATGAPDAGCQTAEPVEVAHAVRLPAVSEVAAVLLVPERRALTATARAVLPDVVPHADAAFNAARSALLVHALTADAGLLFEATEDRLHQRYRAEMMPESWELILRLRAARVPAVISGAGPTVLALVSRSDEAGLRKCRQMRPEGWSELVLDIAARGAFARLGEHADAAPVAAAMLS